LAQHGGNTLLMEMMEMMAILEYQLLARHDGDDGSNGDGMMGKLLLHGTSINVHKLLNFLESHD
jgi:hypothetical protein